jgi:hypothetical protein
MFMPAQDLNDFMRGDTWTQKLTLVQDDAPVDITGEEFWVTLKLNPESAAPDAQRKVTASGADATNGIVYLTLEAADTVDLIPSRYYYDFQRKSGSKVQTLLYGKVRVGRDITRTY